VRAVCAVRLCPHTCLQGYRTYVNIFWVLVGLIYAVVIAIGALTLAMRKTVCRLLRCRVLPRRHAYLPLWPGMGRAEHVCGRTTRTRLCSNFSARSDFRVMVRLRGKPCAQHTPIWQVMVSYRFTSFSRIAPVELNGHCHHQALADFRPS
jgi:hypothetical protein